VSNCQLMRVLLSLLFIPVCFAQIDASYQNSDLPNCGSFHIGKLQGTVVDQTGEPIKDVTVQVFDDVSRKPLWKTVTDVAGRFSTNRRWRGQLRIVFSSPGWLTQDWAVTLVHSRDGGSRRSKAIPVVLEVHRGDGFAVCNEWYSRWQRYSKGEARAEEMEPRAGIEPATSSLQNWRSTN
jgi:hypothetical protein